MPELDARLLGARDYVRPAWTEPREDRAREQVTRRLVRRSRIATATLVILPLLCVATALTVWHRHAGGTRGAAAPVAKAEPRRTLLSLSDGSVALGLSDDARVEPLEVTPERVVVRLVRGSARFEVTPLQHREFTVQAGVVDVTVLGTIFVIDIESTGVDVRVERGRVRADTASGSRVIAAGQRFFFDAQPALPAQPTPSAAPNPEAPVSATPVPPPAVPRTFASREIGDWRALAQAGNYYDAYAALKRSGPAAVHEDPGDLMLAADVARLGGHGSDAVAFLKRVVDRHARDSRAPLAAFTLGRVLLDQLGQPVEAADAFAAARRLAPGGALAQDALAREVESWDRAGDSVRAHERAEEYLRLFPKGQRTNAVRRLGGLD